MMNKVNQTHISEKLIKIFKSAKEFFVNFDSIDLKVSYKKDNPPLTILDTEVDQFIRKELKKINQDFALISEETTQQQANSEYAWIIDPIDGTKELINGSDEFTLNNLDKLFQVILKSATYEFLYKPNLSIKIIIKEYLDASNFFLDDGQTKYLNALLDNIGKKLRSPNA